MIGQGEAEEEEHEASFEAFCFRRNSCTAEPFTLEGLRRGSFEAEPPTERDGLPLIHSPTAKVLSQLPERPEGAPTGIPRS